MIWGDAESQTHPILQTQPSCRTAAGILSSIFILKINTRWDRAISSHDRCACMYYLNIVAKQLKSQLY